MTRLCLKLTFLGTRGNIQIRSARHRRHTSLLVSYRGEDVLVDCGQDWLDEIDALNPSANVLTHAHPDHVGGLARGSPSAVYATADVWRAIGSWPIRDRRRLGHRSPLAIRGLAVRRACRRAESGAATVGRSPQSQWFIHAGRFRWSHQSTPSEWRESDQ
jgi:glyoxylase-like metal-dependent hydrolase (beta-lactamase superfamily II)